MAPGSDCDIAPGWLVQAGSVHSKFEYQRRERGKPRQAAKTSAKKPKGDKKGGGKGGGAANAKD